MTGLLWIGGSVLIIGAAAVIAIRMGAPKDDYDGVELPREYWERKR